MQSGRIRVNLARTARSQVNSCMIRTMFTLRFDITEISHWAAKYSYPQGDVVPIEIGNKARKAGVLTREEFLQVARWKSARPSKHHKKNDEQMVQDVTRLAFSTSSETLRLRSLTLLTGVSDRTASAILHMCHRDPYPMMDVRAFGALGVEKRPRNWSAVWPEYTKACRELADRASVDMRILDRALWAYSDAHGIVAT